MKGISTFGAISLCAVLIVCSLYPTSLFAGRKFAMAQVSIATKDIYAQNSNNLKKLPEFLYLVGVRTAFYTVLRNMGMANAEIKTIKFGGSKGKKSKLLTYSPNRSELLEEFYDDWLDDQDEFLTKVGAMKENEANIIILWNRPDIHELKTAKQFHLMLIIFDIVNRSGTTANLQFDKERWLIDREASQALIVENVIDVVENVKHVLTTSSGGE